MLYFMQQISAQDLTCPMILRGLQHCDSMGTCTAHRCLFARVQILFLCLFFKSLRIDLVMMNFLFLSHSVAQYHTCQFIISRHLSRSRVSPIFKDATRWWILICFSIKNDRKIKNDIATCREGSLLFFHWQNQVNRLEEKKIRCQKFSKLNDFPRFLLRKKSKYTWKPKS